MITFKKLEKNDLESINKYLLLDMTKSCEKTVGALMMWRDFYNVKWAIYDETLIIKYDDPDEVTYMFPIGKNIKGAIETLGKVTYIGVCEENLSYFDSLKAEIKPIRDNFDYIYSAESLRTFKGKSLHGKKNHLNRFKATYNYEFVFDGNKEELAEFFREIDKKQPHDGDTGIAELEETIDMIENREYFGLHSGEIRVDGKIICASIGAQIHDTLYVHIEKADKDYTGSYQAIVSEFASAFPTAEFINREDDLGEEGLRQSKLSYKPLYLLEKYIVAVH